MDCIRILNLKIPARHGVYDFEKNQDGLFELDAELFLNLNIAGNSDQLCDTVDYGEVVKSITGIFTSKDCKLIEAIGEDICQSLLENYPISKIHLRIRKPHAPIIAQFDNVEVELVREK